jgi:hypothetical protein
MMDFGEKNDYRVPKRRRFDNEQNRCRFEILVGN